MSSLILYHHLGLGDHIMCHGVVREYCKKYNRVAIFSLPNNYDSVSFMYRDLKNLTIIKGDKKSAKEFITLNSSKQGNEKYNNVKIIGFENLDWNSVIPLEKQFYKIADIDFAKKWDNFFIERDYKKEKELLNKVSLKGDYAFVHEDTNRKYTIDRNKINKDCIIFTPDIKLTSNIFDYLTIIENAKEVHVIDSSFMFLIDCIKYNNPKQKRYVHRYARENVVWQLPILKKNWYIFNHENNKFSISRYILSKLHKLKILLLKNAILWRIRRKFNTIMGKPLNPQTQSNVENLIRRYVPEKSFVNMSQTNKSSAIAKNAGASNIVTTSNIGDIVFYSGAINDNEETTRLLRNIHETCNDKLILHTPCMPKILGIVKMKIFLQYLKKQQTRAWNESELDENTDQISYLTSQEIETVLQKAGFEVIEKYTFPFESSFICNKITK